MLRVATLLCLAVTVYGSPLGVPHFDGGIVGGEDANIHYPYPLIFPTGGLSNCSGSIISENWILTAAKCVGEDMETISLKAGTTDIGGSSSHSFIEKIVHPLYNASTADYDIALLRLGIPLYDYGVNRLELPTQDESTEAGVNALVTGWGATEPSGTPNYTALQVANVLITSTETCQAAYGEFAITDRMICAGVAEGKTGPCLGDSGGPLVIGNKLIGIVSFGNDCAQSNRTTVFTKVSAMSDWIKTIIGF